MKKIIYTRHVKNRMRWRKIKKDEVENTLNEPLLITDAPFMGKAAWCPIGDRFLKVTYVEENEKIILVSAVYKKNLPKRG